MKPISITVAPHEQGTLFHIRTQIPRKYPHITRRGFTFGAGKPHNRPQASIRRSRIRRQDMTNTKFCFSSKWMYILPFTALAISIQAWAQDGSMHHQYKLTQVGTLGGPDNDFSSSSNYFDIQGGIVGFAATATADPFSPNCFYDCFVDHAIKFQYGTLTGLGALPGTNSSVAIGVNDYGLIVGFSETGSVDPATGYPEYHAVVWEHGVIKDLGTFGGSVSYANAVNNWGQAIGSAANAVPDQYSQDIGCGGWNCWPMSTQMRAFLGRHGPTIP